MPLFTITMRTGRHSGRKSEISSAIHAASISVGYPENDKFQRFFSLDAEDLLIDPTYPGLPRPRTEDFLRVCLNNQFFGMVVRVTGLMDDG